jgi:hypothetical protein
MPAKGYYDESIRTRVTEKGEKPSMTNSNTDYSLYLFDYFMN